MKKIIVFVFLIILMFQLPTKSQLTNTSISEGIKTSVAVGDSPISVAVNPETNKIYVSNLRSDTVSIVDGSKNILITNLSVGTSPQGIDVNPKTNLVYVVNQLSNSVSIIDGSLNTVTTTVNVGKKPTSVRVNPKTNKIYVTNQDDNSVTVIDGSTNTILTTISVGKGPQGLAINTVTNKIYVANSTSDTISVIDGATNAVLKTIQEISTNPFGIALDENRNKIFVATITSGALLSRGKLYIIDGASDSVVDNFSIGSNGTDIAFSSKTNKVYITHTFNSTVDVFDSKGNSLLYILNEINDPAGIVINSLTNGIYICAHFTNSLIVVEDSNAKIKPTKPTDNKPNSSSSGGVTLTGSSSGGTSSESSSSLVNVTTEIDDINTALKIFSKSSKAARSFTKTFSKSINAVNNDLKASDCQDKVTSDLDQLESIFTDVHQKACTNPSKRLLLKTSTKYSIALRMKNCISGQAISDFNDAVDKFNTDITSALPDICGSN